MDNHSHIEIERKFLLNGDFKPFVIRSFRIKQGYLTASPKKTIRVRITEKTGYITIKGEANENGFSRFEWEKEIPKEEAELLMELCDEHVIDKTRHLIEHKGKVFEVDQFHGINEGLLLAELELRTENESFESPIWLGREVTGDKRYYNAYLSKYPYSTW